MNIKKWKVNDKYSHAQLKLTFELIQNQKIKMSKNVVRYQRLKSRLICHFLLQKFASTGLADALGIN
jgi:hypothetical protein